RDYQALGNAVVRNLRDLDAARAAGGFLVYQPPLIAISQLVLVPGQLQDEMRKEGLNPSSYGLAMRFTGPTRRVIRAADGKETEVLVADSNAVADLIVWGQLRPDRDLGSIWFEFGNYSCQGSVRDVCRL